MATNTYFNFGADEQKPITLDVDDIELRKSLRILGFADWGQLEPSKMTFKYKRNIHIYNMQIQDILH